jgi:hypothetical protein
VELLEVSLPLQGRPCGRPPTAAALAPVAPHAHVAVKKVRHQHRRRRRMADPTVYCGNCGTRLDESPGQPPDQRSPCPNCGSTARRFDVTIEDQVAAKATVDAVVEQTHGRRLRSVRPPFVALFITANVVATIVAIWTAGVSSNSLSSKSLLLFGAILGAIEVIAGGLAYLSLARIMRHESQLMELRLSNDELERAAIDTALFEEHVLRALEHRGVQEHKGRIKPTGTTDTTAET